MTRTGWGLPRGAAVGVALVVGLASGPASGRAQDLQRDLERIQNASKASGASLSWLVVEVDGDPGRAGAVLAGYEADAALIPASNMKLITSGAALRVLGTDHVFRTEIGRVGDRLVVRGAGDPALADPVLLEHMDPPMTVGAMLDVLAGAVADAGVAGIEELVLDDRVFDRERVHEAWPRDQLDKQYCAQVSGINFHTNVLRVFVAPGAAGPGSAASVSTQPGADWIRLRNRTRTVAEGTNTIWPTRSAGSNEFTVHGRVVRKSFFPLEVTVHEPARFFGRLLADHLRDRSIDVEAVRLAEADERLDFDRVIARVTTDIEDALRRCNQDSRNLYAECLIKTIGHRVTGEPGSWANGASVVRMLIGEVVGPDAAASAVVSDGSGMSRENRVSARLLCRWLEAMAEDDRFAEVYVRSLAEPGDGTLRKRFLDGGGGSELANELHAKSGYLDGVRALSGYLVDPDAGRTLAFSVLANDLSLGEQDRAAKRFMEDAVRELDRYLTVTAGATAGAPGD